MRLETIPLIAGGLVALFGLLLILDAWLPDDVLVRRERRRRPRRERNRGGELMIGLGILGMAGAFLGLDFWRYRIVAALAGALFLVVGMLKNRAYLGEVLRNRGAKRRADPPMDRGPTAVKPPDPTVPKERIR
ncbi:MAG TPA: hypothetical protein VEA99_21190 [Gemmatimonadaceae bacterium]|nr:hypothetical protein [Gemmatimonadaceae bacterium]